MRIAPLGELKVYAITEAELNELAHGSPSSIHLNFALFFWGVGGSLLATLLATTIQSTRVFVVFVVFFVGTFIPAVVFSAMWWLQHRSTGDLVRRIRDRMPPAPGIQEVPILLPDVK